MNQINQLRELTTDEQKEIVLERILKTIDLSRWDAGDILNSMSANEDVLERIAANQGVSVSAIREYKRTAEAFPPHIREQLFDSDDWLTFTHFKYLAPLVLHRDYGLDVILGHIEIMRADLMTTRETKRYIDIEIKGNAPKSTYKKIADDVLELSFDSNFHQAFYVSDMVCKKPLEDGKRYRVAVYEILNPDVTNP